MVVYMNLSGESGVVGFETAPESIAVKFHDQGIYRYTYASAGAEHVERMKKLAHEGRGLATFINQYVKDKFERQN